jgi:hypothetical protein
MKPRSSCPGRGFCTCDDPPAKRCEILEWQEALTAWKESCIDFDDQESGKWLACYSLGQSDRKLVDILDLNFDGSGRLKTDLIIENVDVETEEVNLTIPCWIWYWSSLAIINDSEDLRECKIFFDYEEMKRYSANHSKLHKSFHLFSVWSVGGVRRMMNLFSSST